MVVSVHRQADLRMPEKLHHDPRMDVQGEQKACGAAPQIMETRIVAGSECQDTGFVFTTRIGTPVDPANLLDEFKRILKKAELPDIRFLEVVHRCRVGIDSRETAWVSIQVNWLASWGRMALANPLC